MRQDLQQDGQWGDLHCPLCAGERPHEAGSQQTLPLGETEGPHHPIGMITGHRHRSLVFSVSKDSVEPTYPSAAVETA